jgi:putative solute:sodium symporter small subunit
MDDRQAPAEREREYWRKTRRITAILLAVWFLVAFGVGYVARELTFHFLGWPFSFWVAAQGALLVFVVIIWYYARYMQRLDREYGYAEDE